MTVNEAFELISNVTPCWDCKYKNSSCNRNAAPVHVWKDGFCHEFDEALSILADFISYEKEPTSQPNNGE